MFEAQLRLNLEKAFFAGGVENPGLTKEKLFYIIQLYG